MQRVSQARAQQLHDEVYDELETPAIDRWVQLTTGMMPLRIFFDQVVLTWEVVLEHGRYYVQHLQDRSGDGLSEEERARRIVDEVKMVGGIGPW